MRDTLKSRRESSRSLAPRLEPKTEPPPPAASTVNRGIADWGGDYRFHRVDGKLEKDLVPMGDTVQMGD